MSVKLSEAAVCAIADPALSSPVYQTLGHLTLARFHGEQGLVRANHVGGSAFSAFAPSGERSIDIVLEGLSDGSDAEGLLFSGFMEGAVRLLRIDTAQGKALSGSFRVTRLQQEAAGERFERITAELRSDGTVTIG